MLTMADRAEIGAGISDRAIGEIIGRDRTVIWRHRRRNTKTCGYLPVTADCTAVRRCRRPRTRKIDDDPVPTARVRAVLLFPRTPYQIAGRLRLEPRSRPMDVMTHSPVAQSLTVSHGAIYRRIYALPKVALVKSGILLRSNRTTRKQRKQLGKRTGARSSARTVRPRRRRWSRATPAPRSSAPCRTSPTGSPTY